MCQRRVSYACIGKFVMKGVHHTMLVKACLTLYRTDAGGRSHPISSGYRPNHVFERKAGTEPLVTCIGEVTLSSERLYPGQSAVVTVRFLVFPYISKYLAVGTRWWINEGARCYGEAEILELVE